MAGEKNRLPRGSNLGHGAGKFVPLGPQTIFLGRAIRSYSYTFPGCAIFLRILKILPKKCLLFRSLYCIVSCSVFVVSTLRLTRELECPKSTAGQGCLRGRKFADMYDRLLDKSAWRFAGQWPFRVTGIQFPNCSFLQVR